MTLMLLANLESSQMARVVKNPPAMQETQETWVQSLGWKDSLEKETAIHSSILAWKHPVTEEPGGLQFMGQQLRTPAAIFQASGETSQPPPDVAL